MSIPAFHLSALQNSAVALCSLVQLHPDASFNSLPEAGKSRFTEIKEAGFISLQALKTLIEAAEHSLKVAEGWHFDAIKSQDEMDQAAAEREINRLKSALVGFAP